MVMVNSALFQTYKGIANPMVWMYIYLSGLKVQGILRRFGTGHSKKQIIAQHIKAYHTCKPLHKNKL